MMGMEQTQRSNAVGANTSYLPSGDTGRDGGGTYTGQATEPTIQDYENFFGPSARDIKTDLQRFKRHGRWHLPDVLQGPNPWLTDRIDGLITDATNSPFTTKILPYRYKEDVDGKIKWNVWSFDEGMASRVPYEAAARTLTQSKRSFAGYMVRQGMAIVLEHNFMMTAKGRENFKNQLNQLIGSIQYTNDLDVHMALVLAPSYQKTLQEKYYTSDKSPSQLCREYADLFGMMQKNVNALDILIEEGKAILRTWGGPMPDFLLCNSKLTFQMTMTPEKTNYITQGIDGVKRLRQGPDLGSYRGLSIIHSRSFAMEAGQHPRDVLRRRVRTAEYYRILPDARNLNREFEFFNEGRDNFFGLSFLDLLRMAKYQSDSPHAATIDELYNKALSSKTSGARGTAGMLGTNLNVMLGYSISEAGIETQAQAFFAILDNVVPAVDSDVTAQKLGLNMCDVFADKQASWFISGIADENVNIIPPTDNDFWQTVTTKTKSIQGEGPFVFVSGDYPHVFKKLYEQCRTKPLNDVLHVNNGQPLRPSNPLWHTTYLYFLDCVKRQGLSSSRISTDDASKINKFEKDNEKNLSDQLLCLCGACGSVNHPFHLVFVRETAEKTTEYCNAILNEDRTNFVHLARSVFLTTELLSILLGKINGQLVVDYFARIGNKKFFPSDLDWQDALNITTNVKSRTSALIDFFEDSVAKLEELNISIERAQPVDFCKLGISTIPMLHYSSTHACMKHNWRGKNDNYDQFLNHLKENSGFLNREALKKTNLNWADVNALAFTENWVDERLFFSTLKQRIFNDPVLNVKSILRNANPAEIYQVFFDEDLTHGPLDQTPVTTILADGQLLKLDMNDFFEQQPDEDNSDRQFKRASLSDVELLVVRPNIEHNMLGIIMGLGGEQLGNTLWGQTELSVYDDSMHGIWGMSYKYHERAIVFNEKNLIRLWDIAYDGYNGGKDDTYVDWKSPRSVDAFKEATLNLGKNYRGQSMMVMAFVHDPSQNEYNNFRRNWPSPIVFYDSYNPGRQATRDTLPLDYDNLQTVDVEEFRVFNNDLYYDAYKEYRSLMPDFRSLHTTRKTAGQSSADSETATDCLAFQGTMRVKEGSSLLYEIQGSGHHGPDYVGIASVRAGKGQKMAGQAPTLHRLI